MSKFKVEFTLKQHTPIIHFQSGQAGATLRATELKPKLDRFLIGYAFDSDFEKYKTYFGNMSKDSNDEEFKKAISCKDKIILEFLTFQTKLKLQIKEYFSSFLATTTFVTASS